MAQRVIPLPFCLLGLAKLALAHIVANKVEAAYHRADPLVQRWPMMEGWSKHDMANQ